MSGCGLIGVARGSCAGRQGGQRLVLHNTYAATRAWWWALGSDVHGRGRDTACATQHGSMRLPSRASFARKSQRKPRLYGSQGPRVCPQEPGHRRHAHCARGPAAGLGWDVPGPELGAARGREGSAARPKATARTSPLPLATHLMPLAVLQSTRVMLVVHVSAAGRVGSSAAGAQQV
jgi:hypothetical protein